MKVCKICNVEKELVDIVKDKNIKSGYANFCKDCNRLKSKKFREENKEQYKEYYKEYYNREDVKKRQNDYMKNYINENRELLSINKKKWREENRDKIKQQKNEYRKMKKETDPIYRLHQLISSIIRKSFNYSGFKKSSRTHEIIGISFEEFKLYLECKFEPWMTWDNRGLYNGELNYGWDIDHIIPISSAKTEDDIIRLNNYKNLQPLCSKINRDIKKDKY